MRKHNHYFRDVSRYKMIDIYRFLELFGVTDPALQHAIKKLVVPGMRGAKPIVKDISEAIDTLQRKLEMLAEDTQEDVPKGEVDLSNEKAVADMMRTMAQESAKRELNRRIGFNPLLGRTYGEPERPRDFLGSRVTPIGGGFDTSGLTIAGKAEPAEPLDASLVGKDSAGAQVVKATSSTHVNDIDNSGPQVGGTMAGDKTHPELATVLSMPDSEFLALTNKADPAPVPPEPVETGPGLMPVGCLAADAEKDDWKPMPRKGLQLTLSPMALVRVRSRTSIGTLKRVRHLEFNEMAQGEEWRFATLNEGGWVRSVGVKPEGHAKVTVLFRDGTILNDMHPDNVVWEQHGVGGDALAWRLPLEARK